jgi:hypothetical protein
MSNGREAQASFTWGKCLDHSSSGDIGDAYQNSIPSLIFFAPGDRRGPCDFNIVKNFVANWIWDVPVPKSDSWAVSHLAGGWELGGIITASTGSPVTLVMNGDPLGQKNGDTYDFPNRVSGCNPIMPNWRSDPNLQYINVNCFTPATAPPSLAAQCATFSGAGTAPNGQVWCSNLLGNSGRNSVSGPGLVNLDFSVFKNNYIPRISESFNVQFRAEMFNILNHANFQTPIDNSVLFEENGSLTGGGGTLNKAAADNREIQLSLKVIW